MKIAVLGAGGFLGKIICEYLRSNGHTVFAVTRRELTLTDYLSVQ
jgi:nucleoside-diphosphate-sugar epimerase